ncbi:MAG TPA: HAMP domain-containing sensor histidine kinase [Planctomycetota bacterium]|nr:HAMP domain-containing sensor histidine kinase [Planctomycetota bacterium]HPY75493.1 HAMP domain-containing sensor histidine kinase [Planctomycetota bacterium]HQB00333.1 HAMP domain-containing sensor histidine kinase [Planctomycetota bacterium]HRU52292.1 HAMP domain-containing sensor histidine kinase [Planctomycetota bacterium]
MKYEFKLLTSVILLIIFPCFSLVGFALQSLGDQKLIIEKKIEESYTALVSTARKQILDKIISKVKKIEETLQNEENISTSKFLEPLSDSLFEKVYVVDKNYNIIYPQERPIDVHIENVYMLMEDHHIFENAYFQEFQIKNYETAIIEYKNIIANIQDKKIDTMGQALASIARCQLYLQQEDKALETYQSIVNLYRDSTSARELRFLLEIKLQILEIYKKNKKWNLYYRNILDILKYILFNEFRFKKVQYYYYIEKIQKELQKLEHEENLSLIEKENFLKYKESILEEHSKIEQQEKEIQEIQKYVLPTLQREKENSGYIPYEIRNIQYLIYYCKTPIGYVLYNIDLDYCLKDIIAPTVHEQDMGPDIRLSLLSNNGISLLIKPDARFYSVVSQPLQPIFPFWHMVLYLKNIRSLEDLSRYRSELYLTGLIVLISFLLLGVYIIIYTYVREMKNVRFKSTFVGNITHELKTPLTAIKIFVETLQMERTQSRSEQRECLQIIAAESERLSRLIDQILSFAKMEQKKRTFHFHPCKIEEWIEEIIQDFQNQIPAKANCKITFQKQDNLPEIYIDQESIREAWMNLLSNAYKYNDKQEKHIDIQIYCHKEDEIALSIKDNGIGIPRNELHRIFKKFYRVENRDTLRIEGTGLGLFLVESIVKAHKGNIKVQSKFQQGSEFTLYLPIQQKI